MTSAEEAVNTLITVNQGTYTIKQHSTTTRTFKPSYTNNIPGFRLDKELNNKILSAYVSHEWINK